MDQLTYKEGNFFIGDMATGTDVKACVAVISAYTGKEQKETCDLLNNLMQSFVNLWEKVKEAIKKLADLIEDKVICDSCDRCKRTRHGSSSNTLKICKVKQIIKWRYKIRPP